MVTLGEYDKRYLSKNNIRTGVDATVVHEKYKHGPEKYPKYLNDIGMILISKKVKETGIPTIQQQCLKPLHPFFVRSDPKVTE